RGIIVAVSPEGIIGKDGKIPWHYSGDLKRFKRVTMNTTVIMGRLTWESVGRPLPGRRNIVITRSQIPSADCFDSIKSALQGTAQNEPVWFIGGARIYAKAMPYCDVLDVTYVPDHIDPDNSVYFPPIDPKEWDEGPLLPHEDEPRLHRRV